MSSIYRGDTDSVLPSPTRSLVVAPALLGLVAGGASLAGTSYLPEPLLAVGPFGIALTVFVASAIALIWLVDRPMRRAVLNEHSRTEEILTNLEDGLILLDEHGSIQFLNPAAARLFGYAAEESIGRRID